jgi:YlmC/YmxH family sporulation protein
MALSYSELKKRDVINVTDGRCLGKIIDMRFTLPEAIIVGIVVPGRKTKGFLRLFDRSELYIDESRVIKIGGDVILVDINCGDTCSTSVKVNRIEKRPEKHVKPCPPPCNPCPPQHFKGDKRGNEQVDFGVLSGSQEGYYEDE